MVAGIVAADEKIDSASLEISGEPDDGDSWRGVVKLQRSTVILHRSVAQADGGLNTPCGGQALVVEKRREKREKSGKKRERERGKGRGTWPCLIGLCNFSKIIHKSPNFKSLSI
ncbi:hypothetical protein PanWU01x14_012260 [Parasponia andersonii]|uniref:Uncharacterized protein n=1 Tax=Parasponia andersonii TaxID=3476 RepID=A0A2P5E1T3_PARAD|nr:hypothetical protein PanWU01x14_012260 [Parasponia andersonii]